MTRAAPMTLEEFTAKGKALFGDDPFAFRFVCPSCGNVQTMQQFHELGVTDPNLAYRNCIGRHDGKHMHVELGTNPGPCNYTSGGLFDLNPCAVIHPFDGKPLTVFAFDGANP